MQRRHQISHIAIATAAIDELIVADVVSVVAAVSIVFTLNRAVAHDR